MTKTFQQPADQEIARYAYYLWESEGCVHGRDLDYWLQAKAHLTTTREYEAGILATQPAASARKAPDLAASPNADTISKSAKKRSARSAHEPHYV
ncbi:MAG: DUF2934 domain-containing protein [Verrucomicrobiota bacterium]